MEDSSPTAENEPNLGNLLLEMSATIVVPSRDFVNMTDFNIIGSYNWLNSKIPTMLVPGMCSILRSKIAARENSHLY